jgi:hypothetical protein
MNLGMNLNKIIHRNDELKLNLSRKTVLTEAATGAYSATAIAAALAGAKVYALAKNTRYGAVEDIRRLFSKLPLSSDAIDITVIEDISTALLSEIDIVTNSGHLRPIGDKFVKSLKPGAVIALMYEAWELRSSDIDLKSCKTNNIKVVATNERHNSVGVFDYLGDMAIKLILDSGLSLNRNKYILVSNNDFGPYIAATLSKVVSHLGIIDTMENRDKYDYSENVQYICGFNEFKVPGEYRDTEGVIFNAYPFEKAWIGNEKSCLIHPQQLKNQLTLPVVLRFAGDINTADLDLHHVKYYPTFVTSGHMGIIPSEVGYDPIIRLQCGSLKAAELAHNNQALTYLDTKIGQYL